ncbi:MAG: hypothetical protein M3Z56_03745 [Bacteroidota bacterium]|nr:hypothetical protein [Bacteroidota bacterium]
MAFEPLWDMRKRIANTTLTSFLPAIQHPIDILCKAAFGVSASNQSKMIIKPDS